MVNERQATVVFILYQLIYMVDGPRIDQIEIRKANKYKLADLHIRHGNHASFLQFDNLAEFPKTIL